MCQKCKNHRDEQRKTWNAAMLIGGRSWSSFSTVGFSWAPRHALLPIEAKKSQNRTAFPRWPVMWYYIWVLWYRKQAQECHLCRLRRWGAWVTLELREHQPWCPWPQPRLWRPLGRIAGLATYSIFFCFLLMKNHWFTWRANQWPLSMETLLYDMLFALICRPSRALA